MGQYIAVIVMAIIVVAAGIWSWWISRQYDDNDSSDKKEMK